MISAGDQINETSPKGSAGEIQQQEYQYSGFLSPQALRSLPVATTIGNHDSLTNGYGNHFNTPNPFTSELNPTAAGHGYYYSYGNALFIVLNTNNYNAADHKALIEKAIAADPSAKWRIVMIHQDIYGSGLDHSDSDGIILRTQLTTIFDEEGIDVVLQGHDHTYARTYQLSGDGKQHESFNKSVKLGDVSVKTDFLKENLCYNIVDKRQGIVKNPKGIFYMTANSATGSKFYELIPVQQDYIAKRNQTWRPTYSVIHIKGDRFSMTTYDVTTGNPIDDTYTIVKDK
jgi:3',5'-cyclic AMP phosphodiesterase CpdA